MKKRKYEFQNSFKIVYKYFKTVFLALVYIFSINGVLGQTNYENLLNVKESETCDSLLFREPSVNFRPQIWVHFISGNVSLQGIKADIKTISEAGFSGIQLFHEHRGGGPWPRVEPQIECLSKDWDGMIKEVAEECKRKDLKFTMQNCPGWAMAGGPWIEPKDAMRHLVWSRKDIKGDRPVRVKLPHPVPDQNDWRDYQDVAVIAFPTTLDDTSKPLKPAKVISNREDLNWERWINREKESTVILKASNKPTWLEIVFNDEVTIRTVEFPPVRSLYHGWEYDPYVEVKVEAIFENHPDKVIAFLDLPRSNWQENKPLSIGCQEVASKRYRLSVTNSRYDITLNPVAFYSAARKTNWEGEAAWVLRESSGLNDPEQSEDTRIKRENIINLSEYYDEEGYLNWEVPSGNWTVLRWGHVNTGKKNGPAPPEATGFECNKLSPIGAETHFAGYIGRLSGPNGPLQGDLLQGLLIDSWECETQTWTKEMKKEFRQRRGYDLIKWLPAIAGYIIDDPEITTKFLRDWRATINDLMVKNFYGRMTELAHKRGLMTYYETASGDVFPADILEYHKHADVPMCEFWQPRTESGVGSIEKKSVKPTVSAARLYGKKRVAVESFTSHPVTWNEHPGMLKSVVDFHLAKGVTYPVFQAYTHTPWIDFKPPGTSFGGNIGTPFLRGQTWWKEMPEFTKYLSRCTYMLENGKPVSDVLFYLGDEIQHKPRQNMPFPDGYQYDYCNPDILLNRLTVNNSIIETPEGLNYRVIWLPNSRRMLPETIERLISLVKDGAIMVGNPPENIATLSGGKEAEARFSKAVKALWGKNIKSQRRLGKGMVMSNITIDDALDKLKIGPDLIIEKVHSGNPSELSWIHRKNNIENWYFITNSECQQGFNGILKFRSTGKAEIWDPVTGKITNVAAIETNVNCTNVEINLPPSGSLFIVFKSGKHTLKTYRSPSPTETVKPVAGPWKLTFPTGWGAPDSITVNSLVPWKDMNISNEAKAFSGTVIYKTTFEIDKVSPHKKVKLDLGKVNIIAKVWINGINAGTVWTEPYLLDITNQVNMGLNQLEIEVTSTWFNRLVYDAGQNESERKTWTIDGPSREENLLSYGLLGPITLKFFR